MSRHWDSAWLTEIHARVDLAKLEIEDFDDYAALPWAIVELLARTVSSVLYETHPDPKTDTEVQDALETIHAMTLRVLEGGEA